MEISLAAVTESKRFSKAFIRVSGALDMMRECAKDISTANEPFDILQVVFRDRPETFIEVKGATDGSRLFQVLAGLPRDLNFKPQDDPVLVSEIKKQLLIAIDRSTLSPETKSKAISKVQAQTPPGV
jgi:hypothetical protein